eukprot:TRINITY_DN6437_c0_g1_i2.p2 TRINITY_DN6437_c0_g1~~TRINITY_DN6437_c0_g1_i2.p2  ORF type:complete len:267 (+),score=22.45 TRINITY_DN6437_c0_g1_i2:1003-1803(+)
MARSACLFAAILSTIAATNVTGSIDSRSAFTLSHSLSGIHIVYCWAPSSLYGNGTFATWANNASVHTARYPGGTASYWNWQRPTGYMGQSSFSPSWNGTQAPASEWMSLDTYLELAKDAGFLPMVGVNYASVKVFNVPLNESLTAARHQVQTVLNHGYRGAWFYIGNEDTYEAGGLEESARLVKQHANAMREVDPNITIFFNNNDITPDQLEVCLLCLSNYHWVYFSLHSSVLTKVFNRRVDIPIHSRHHHQRCRVSWQVAVWRQP